MIKCSCCERVLYVTHQDRYEDLSDHVSSSNPSMKDGYQCMNDDCIANAFNVTWIHDGEFFIDPPEGICYAVAKNVLEKASKNNVIFALNSWNYHYELGKRTVKKWTWKVSLGKWKFVFIPREKGWDYVEEERYQPALWRWKMEIWKGSSEHGYTNVVPIHKSIKWNIERFNKNYSDWKESSSLHDFSACEDAILRRHSWGAHDDRIEARITSMLIQVIYPNKCKEVLFHK
jgi:hypothetical protein